MATATGNGNGAWWKSVISYLVMAILGASLTVVIGGASVVSRAQYDKDLDRISVQMEKHEEALTTYDREVRTVLVDLMTKTTRIEAQIEELNRRLDAQGYYPYRSNPDGGAAH